MISSLRAKSLPRITLGFQAFAVGCALAGLALVLFSTARYGPGVNSDASAYLAGARHLAAGQGFRLYDGVLMTNFPPLLPAILAAAYGLLAVEPTVTARFLNASAFAAIVWLAARLFRLQFHDSPALAYTGTVAVLLSFPLLYVSVQVWTEPLFIVLALLFLLTLHDYAQGPSLRAVALLSVTAGLACLTRYLGVALIGTGLVVMILNPALRLSVRVRHALLFGVAAALPLAVWCVRNLAVAGVLFGTRAEGQVAPVQNLVATLDTLWSWFLPLLSGEFRYVVYALCCLFGGALLPRLMMCNRRRIRIDSLPSQSAFLFIIYLAALLVSSASADVTPANDRFLSPLTVPAYLMVLAAGQAAYRALRVRHAAHVLTALALACSVAWLGYASIRLAVVTVDRVYDGVGGYSTTAWRQSQTMDYLRTRPFPDAAALYSNRPDGIYVLTGLGAAMSPSKKTGYMSRARADLSAWPDRMPAYLVWFPTGDTRTYLYELDEMQQARVLTLEHHFADGDVYRIERQKGRP